MTNSEHEHELEFTFAKNVAFAYEPSIDTKLAVILDDLERRNSPNRRVISPNSIDFGADDAKVVEAGLPLTGVQAYYTPENLAKTPKIRWPGVRVRPK